MKRHIAYLLSLAMIISVAACAPAGNETTTDAAKTTNAPETDVPETTKDYPKLTPGTYEATTQGRGGKITVAVTVDENSIQKVEVVSNGDTATLADAAAAKVTADIVEYQTVYVDTVAGATVTSAAVRYAATLALQQAADDISAFEIDPQYAAITVEDATCDVVVVGAGAAGMLAAIKAHEGGANVILVEKQGLLGGGDAMFASSGMSGGNGSSSPDLIVENYSEEDYLQSLLDKAATKNIDLHVPSATAYAMMSGDVLDYYVSIGVPFGKRTEKNGFSNKTTDGSAPGTHIIRCLGEELDRLNIDYRLNSRATSIVMENGITKGIVVSTDAGEYIIHADAVILASGGFGANDELIQKYAPQWLGLPSTGASSATGDGILMAMEAGADIWNMDQTKANDMCHVTENGATISLTTIGSSSVFVNKEGKRFVNEASSSVNEKSYAKLQQTDKEVYAIFDSTQMEKALIQGYNALGYFVSANTFEELADQMDVDKEAFLTTMNNFRQYCIDGMDPEFGNPLKETLEDAPYYAVVVTPSMQSTYGGVRTDENARVLTPAGEIIPGLYAAGAVSGHGCFGNEVGNGLTIASTFGIISAQSALEDLAK